MCTRSDQVDTRLIEHEKLIKQLRINARRVYRVVDILPIEHGRHKLLLRSVPGNFGECGCLYVTRPRNESSFFPVVVIHCSYQYLHKLDYHHVKGDKSLKKSLEFLEMFEDEIVRLHEQRICTHLVVKRNAKTT